MHNIEQVRSLLNAGAPVDERDEFQQQTALMRAAQAGDLAMARLLLAHGADVNAQDDEGQTALMFAVERGSPALVRLFLVHYARMDTRNDQGATALQLAQKQKRTTLVKLLQKADRAGTSLHGQQLAQSLVGR